MQRTWATPSASFPTLPEIEDLLIDIYRRMPTRRKIELVEDANRTARQLAWAGLHSRHPGESKSRLRRRLLDKVLGEEIALAVYGPTAEVGE